jgi:hypothetical protein
MAAADSRILQELDALDKLSEMVRKQQSAEKLAAPPSCDLLDSWNHQRSNLSREKMHNSVRSTRSAKNNKDGSHKKSFLSAFEGFLLSVRGNRVLRSCGMVQAIAIALRQLANDLERDTILDSSGAYVKVRCIAMYDETCRSHCGGDSPFVSVGYRYGYGGSYTNYHHRVSTRGCEDPVWAGDTRPRKVGVSWCCPTGGGVTPSV